MFNAVFSVVILGSNVSPRTIACLGVVIVGFIVGVGGEIKLSLLGVQWGLISSVSVSLNSIYTKKVSGLLPPLRSLLSFAFLYFISTC